VQISCGWMIRFSSLALRMVRSSSSSSGMLTNQWRKLWVHPWYSKTTQCTVESHSMSNWYEVLNNEGCMDYVSPSLLEKLVHKWRYLISESQISEYSLNKPVSPPSLPPHGGKFCWGEKERGGEMSLEGQEIYRRGERGDEKVVFFILFCSLLWVFPSDRMEDLLMPVVTVFSIGDPTTSK
jgi:hypothetical protein